MRLSRSIVVAAVLLGAVSFSQAADFTIDSAHSSVGFTVRHLVSNTKGQFNDFTGSFSYDAKAPEKSTVDAVIQTKSINTANEKRDGHLRSADFFDAEKYPTLTFKSTSAKSLGAGKLQVTGNLTLHGVTKPVVLDVQGGEVVKDPFGTGKRTGFSATTTINRKDYGIVWNKTMDNGGLMLGEDIKIALEVEGVSK